MADYDSHNSKMLGCNNRMKATYKQAVDSLFSAGGTTTEDYIELSEGKQVVAKVPVSQFTQYNVYTYDNEVIKGNCNILYAKHENSLVIFDSKTKQAKAWMVEHNSEWAYKFLKTKIRAQGGIEGLIATINRFNGLYPMNSFFAGTLKLALETN